MLYRENLQNRLIYVEIASFLVMTLKHSSAAKLGKVNMSAKKVLKK